MYFEVFLEIFVASFALFGFFSLLKLLWIVFFGYDNLKVCVEVDTPETAENIDLFLKEAKSTCLAIGGRGIFVVVEKKYCSEELVNKLEENKIRYTVNEK